ncbi:hypothetical protein [Paenibacillus sp. Soil522]|uniref:hypothetical protein n=1 Tax=Paenibacillus sp. Soil522 TaxID=1736388 RepID=UPI0006F7DAB8|nr:hypothetical protein [Paenibacillus sp. Soil522]KRE30266.1 hypothetical protein ASG81_25335 [Paenibacillus sp. Soil522]
MNPFPEEYEFIELFESLPEQLDKSVPFFYNNNVYKLSRSNGDLFFEMEPGSHWSRVAWKQAESFLIDLTLDNIKGIEIEKRNGNEYLHFYFYENQGLKPLIIRTKPEISMVWGTTRD